MDTPIQRSQAETITCEFEPCAQHLGSIESADNLSAVVHPTPILTDGGAPFHPFDNRPHQYPNRHGTAVSGFVSFHSVGVRQS